MLQKVTTQNRVRIYQKFVPYNIRMEFMGNRNWLLASLIVFHNSYFFLEFFRLFEQQFTNNFLFASWYLVLFSFIQLDICSLLLVELVIFVVVNSYLFASTCLCESTVIYTFDPNSIEKSTEISNNLKVLNNQTKIEQNYLNKSEHSIILRCS